MPDDISRLTTVAPPSRSFSRLTFLGSILSLSMLSAALAAPALGQCATLRSDRLAIGSSIGLTYDDDVNPRTIDGAIAMWSSCSNAGYDFPEFVNGGGGTRTVNVRYVAGSSGSNRCGQFVGREIILYQSAVSTGRRPRACGAMEQNLAHELGHVFGLSDLKGSGQCMHHIMAQISRKNAQSRAVRAEECQLVGQRWQTYAEREAANDSEIPSAP